MHTDPDDVSELERRLAGWRPAERGLDADAMLFAAGRAAARPGRLWAALAGSLAALALGLGTWAMSERAGRLALAERLHAPATPPAPLSPTPTPGPAETPSPSSLLVARRAVEHGLDTWRSPAPGPPAPGAPSPPVVRLGARNAFLDP